VKRALGFTIGGRICVHLRSSAVNERVVGFWLLVLKSVFIRVNPRQRIDDWQAAGGELSFVNHPSSMA
jgi:hypothetical protein